MRRFLAAAAAFWITVFASAAYSEAARQLQWADLAPPMEKLDDPFEGLSMEQKIDLSMVAVVHELQARRDSALGPEQLKSYNEMVEGLRRAKVDIDGRLARRAEIIEKRRKAAETVNERLNGQQVRIPGYVLPLEMDGKKVTEFLLVPYVGACIHAPTPPPNQIVHVKHGKGFEAAGLFAPVWVQGVMRTVRGRQRLSFIDGTADIPTSYALDAATIEPYRE